MAKSQQEIARGRTVLVGDDGDISAAPMLPRRNLFNRQPLLNDMLYLLAHHGKE
jgi:hypothetical protein